MFSEQIAHWTWTNTNSGSANQIVCFSWPVFVTNYFNSSIISNIPPVANSDREAQLFTFKPPAKSCSKKTVIFMQHDNVAKLLSQNNWHIAFSCCVPTDNFANVFINLLYIAVNASKRHKLYCRRERQPKYIVQILRKKKRAWLVAKRTHNYTNFKQLSRSVTTAVKKTGSYLLATGNHFSFI